MQGGFTIKVRSNINTKEVYLMDRTLVLLKPDSIERGLIGKIIEILESNNGLRIQNIKKVQLNEALLRQHYAHLVSKPFFKEILEYMTRSHVFAMILEGENAVSKVRELCGATNPLEASKHSIRGMFGICKEENLVHSSDSIESAEIEIKRFFEEEELPTPLITFP